MQKDGDFGFPQACRQLVRIFRAEKPLLKLRMNRARGL